MTFDILTENLFGAYSTPESLEFESRLNYFHMNHKDDSINDLVGTYEKLIPKTIFGTVLSYFSPLFQAENFALETLLSDKKKALLADANKYILENNPFKANILFNNP